MNTDKAQMNTDEFMARSGAQKPLSSFICALSVFICG
jgi:hypothetical protein